MGCNVGAFRCCFYMSAKNGKMSVSSAQTTFWVFAALMGLSLSSIFLAYTGAKYFKSFLYYFNNFWSNEFIWLTQLKEI